MANDSDPKGPRFPLRRDADAPPAPPPAQRTARTTPRPWSPPPVDDPGGAIRPRAAKPRGDDALELTHGLPPADQWAMPPAEPFQPKRKAAPPPPPPPPPHFVPEPVLAGPGGYTTNLPVVIRKRRWLKWVVRVIAVFILLFIAAVAWLALTAPLSKSLQPPAPPSITLLSAEGTPIARRGAVIGAAVDAAKLPPHVRNAFIAIEDRRFYSHWGVDLRGTARALVHNLTGAGGTQGGSTITQQLAKNAFLNSSRTAGRKVQEAMIAFWLEYWLTKDEILSRYLSNVYFGDNVYGLSAAAHHYFSCDPDQLTVSQASLLAGLVQAPSRLAPTGNLGGARDRQKLVLKAMVDNKLLDKAEAARVRPAVLKVEKTRQIPNGGYFADWVLPQARDRAGGVATQQEVQTTLETRAQKAAEMAIRNVGLKKAQIAIVAMHPDGRVVAMVGGTNYGASPFNRATQARRQPGSTFKLFVYLAALRSGMTPDSSIEDTPFSYGGWSPSNSHNQYSGTITLKQAFAKSSNVAAARLTQKLGVRAVTQAARDLGISTPIGNELTIGLGTSTVSLLELTSAYASVAQGAYPVRPLGLAPTDADDDWLASKLNGPSHFPDRQLDDLRELLAGVVQSGTGRGAALPIPAFGKTGTTQDNRDALFVGYAGGLVAGVWLGNDDNSPNPGLVGSGIPARVWRDFMTHALDLKAAPAPEPTEDVGALENEGGGNGLGDLIDAITGGGQIETDVDTGDGDATDGRGPDDRGPPPRGPRGREDGDIRSNRFNGGDEDGAVRRSQTEGPQRGGRRDRAQEGDAGQ